MNDKIEIKPQVITPLKKICMTIGELPTSYLETMTYYEMLVWFTNYLRDTIIPVVNNNGEAVTELQNLFVELQTYVNNYFDNLDVQEEINNKLDNMVEQGTLQEIIYTYLDSTVTWTFNNIQAMQQAPNLIAGSTVKTLGYTTINDGGGALYKVTDEELTPNGGNIIEINNELCAVLIPVHNEVYSMQFGCAGDGETDDYQKIQNLFNYVSNNLRHGCKIIINGLHYIDGDLQINGSADNKLSNVSLIGLDGMRSYWDQKSLKYGFIFNSNHTTQSEYGYKYGLRINQSVGFVVKYLMFTTDEEVPKGGVPQNSLTLLRSMNSVAINIEKCNFTKGFIGYYSYYNGLATIRDNNFAQCNIGLRMAENGDSQIVDNYINTNGFDIYNLDGTLKSDYQTLYNIGQLFGCGIYIGGSGNHTIKGGKIEWNAIGVWQDYTTNIIYDGIQFDRCSLVGISITGHSSIINRTLITNCNFSGCGGINPTSTYQEKHIGGVLNACISANSSFGLTITNNKFIGDNGSLRNAFKTSGVYYGPNKAVFFNKVYESIFAHNIIQIDQNYLGEIVNSEIMFDGNITNKNLSLTETTLLYKMEGLKKKVFHNTTELTDGNFNQGDEIINWSTLISGWRCTTAGTLKAINTTVSVVTVATDYYPGDGSVIDCGTTYVDGIRTGAYVNIAGVTGTKQITGVIKINDHYYAKLNSACDVAVLNATMTNQAPAFTSLS